MNTSSPSKAMAPAASEQTLIKWRSGWHTVIGEVDRKGGQLTLGVEIDIVSDQTIAVLLELFIGDQLLTGQLLRDEVPHTFGEIGAKRILKR